MKNLKFLAVIFLMTILIITFSSCTDTGQENLELQNNIDLNSIEKGEIKETSLSFQNKDPTFPLFSGILSKHAPFFSRATTMPYIILKSSA